uniref:Uncharacterized protein n=1 Tax=Strix occidentalis caurina TaxID=311401 RepID=A0A8D0FGT4_STROC
MPLAVALVGHFWHMADLRWDPGWAVVSGPWQGCPLAAPGQCLPLALGQLLLQLQLVPAHLIHLCHVEPPVLAKLHPLHWR